MGDHLAAIREKSQAHQEESKAKRFRDRGGLWQPLSPSKNMLKGILNSAEFRNIAEADTITKQKDEDYKLAEGSQNSIARGRRSKLSTNEKARNVGTKDVFTEDAKNQTRVVPVKPKGSHKAIKKFNSRAKVGSDRHSDHGSGDETPSVSHHHKVSSSTRSEKNDTIKKSQQQAPLTTGNEGVAGESWPQGSPQCSKRSKRKRKTLGEDSDQEDIESDYRPSPAKKPRTRGSARSVSVKSKSTKQAKGSKPTDRRSKVKEKPVQLNDEDLVEGRTELSLNSQGAGTTMHSDAPSDQPSTKRRRKRALVIEVFSADEEQSPPKRRRTTTVPEPAQDPKVMKSKPKSKTDDSSLDWQDNNKENLKPRARRGSKPPKSPVKPKSQLKSKSKSRRVSSDKDSDAEMTADDDIPGPKSKLRDPRLSTIMEAEESDGEHRSPDGLSTTRVSECPRILSKVVDREAITQGGSAVPVQKQRQAPTMGSLKETSHQDEAVAPAIASTSKTKVGTSAKCKGVDATEVHLDVPKDNGRAGMTKRRRKKVEHEAEPKDGCRAMDMPIVAQDAREPQEDIPMDKVNQKGSARGAARQKYADAKLQQPSPSELSQSNMALVGDSAVNALSKRTTTKRTRSTKSKPNGCSKRRPEMDQVEDDVVPNLSAKKSKDAVEKAQKKPEQRKVVIRSKPPPLRHVEFEAVLESDVDELDLLS